MNRTKSFAMVAIILMAGVLLVLFNGGCSDNNVGIINEPETTTGMLVFRDYDEYFEAIQKVKSLQPDELKAWEEAQGFSSFGRHCDELYSIINPDAFETINEIKTFVEQNSQYLELVELESGEYVLEVALDNHLNRHIINKDKMFVIGSSVYKIYSDGVAKAGIAHKDVLKNCRSLEEVKKFVTTKQKTTDQYPEIKVKNIVGPGTFLATKWNEKDRDALRLTISLDYLHATEMNVHGGADIPVTYVNNFVRIRGYRKNAGIWMHTQTSLSADFRVLANYNGTDTYHHVTIPKEFGWGKTLTISNIWHTYDWVIPVQTIKAYGMLGTNHRGVSTERSLNPHLLP